MADDTQCKLIEAQYKVIEGMLYNYRKTQVEIDNLKLKIEEIESDFKGISAMSYEERAAPTNAFNSSVENEIVNKEREIALIVNKIKHKEIQLQKIDNAIEALDNRNKKIIYMKYFDKRTSRDIAAKLDLTEVHVCRLKKRIINMLIPIILN